MSLVLECIKLIIVFFSYELYREMNFLEGSTRFLYKNRQLSVEAGLFLIW